VSEQDEKKEREELARELVEFLKEYKGIINESR